MNNHFPSRTSLFLIELMISIFFFILSTTVVLQLFIKSYQLSQKTIYTNEAHQCAQNLTELFLGCNADYQFVKAHFSGLDCSHFIEELPSSLQPPQKNSEDSLSKLLLLYDKDWNTCTTISEADFYVHVLFSKESSFAYETIYITSDIPFLNCETTFEPFYELTIQKYLPQYSDISKHIGD